MELPRLLPDAESLPSTPRACRCCRSFERHAVPQRHLCVPVQRRARTDGACLPGPIPRRAGTARRAPARVDPLHRAQSCPRRVWRQDPSSGDGRAMAQPPASARDRNGSTKTGCLPSSTRSGHGPPPLCQVHHLRDAVRRQTAARRRPRVRCRHRERRDDHGYTQAEIAAHLGVSQANGLADDQTRPHA